jgi:methylenetetrahydrofolate reductase (NADPH)
VSGAIAMAAVRTAGFARTFSIEGTRPSADEIAQLAGILPAGTQVYVTAVPTAAPEETVAAAAALRRTGLDPVVHIAARRLASEAQLADLLARLRGEADTRRLLVIGGYVEAAGPFADALAVIQKGRLRAAGIEEIGIGAYPEGHPRIPAARLEASLDEKIASATAQGLRVHIASQFSFSGERIIAWLKQLRAGGIAVPVKIGLAGPTSVPALIRYAKRCGVNASLRGLMSGAASALIGNVGPDRIIEVLSDAQGELGDVLPHYVSFGGLVATARYAQEKAGANTAPAVASSR